MAKEKKYAGRKVLFVGASIVIVLTAIFVFLTFQRKTDPSNSNLASQITAPLEKELTNAGAKKVCSGGDNGRGTDNRSPYYRAYLELDKTAPEAITLVNSAASSNGFKLTHASPENRGFLGAVADTYINKWYFDDTSKQSSFDELKPGNIRLAAVIEEQGSENPCDSNAKVPTGYTFIGVEARLPDYK